MAAAALCAVLFTATSAEADPQATPQDVESAFAAAEAANESVNQARADQASLQSRIAQIDADIASAQASYDQQRAALAASVVQQQIDQPLGPTVSLINSGNSDAFLQDLSILQTVDSARSDAVQQFRQSAADLQNRKAQLAQQQAQLAQVVSTAKTKQAQVTAAYRKAQTQFAQLQPVAQKQLQVNDTTPPATVMPGGSAAAQTAVAFALAHLGDPYVYGGTGPHQWDCSGLVQAAYRAAGVSLPRVVGPQMAAGQRITAAQLQPGDLVAYSSMSHIGIYIGNGQVVHAPRPGLSVQITSLSNGFSVYSRVA